MIVLFAVLSTVGMYIEWSTFETSAPRIVTGLHMAPAGAR